MQNAPLGAFRNTVENQFLIFFTMAVLDRFYCKCTCFDTLGHICHIYVLSRYLIHCLVLVQPRKTGKSHSISCGCFDTLGRICPCLNHVYAQLSKHMVWLAICQDMDKSVKPEPPCGLTLPIDSRAQWLSGRVLDWITKGRGLEPHLRHCVVSLSKTHYS